MDKTLILNRLKDYKKFKTSKDFAEFLGVKPTTLSMWYKRNTFDSELLFTKFEGINANWLLTGKGEMLKESKELKSNTFTEDFFINALKTERVKEEIISIIKSYSYEDK